MAAGRDCFKVTQSSERAFFIPSCLLCSQSMEYLVSSIGWLRPGHLSPSFPVGEGGGERGEGGGGRGGERGEGGGEGIGVTLNSICLCTLCMECFYTFNCPVHWQHSCMFSLNDRHCSWCSHSQYKCIDNRRSCIASPRAEVQQSTIH